MDRETIELEARMRAALASIEQVRVAYLFGSRARGDERPDSDLDVAIAFLPHADRPTREQTRRAVIAALTDALGAVGESADVVDLDDADSAVAFRAIKDGQLLLTRTPADRVHVEVRVGRRYDDDAPKRVLFRRAALAAVARMGMPGA